VPAQAPLASIQLFINRLAGSPADSYVSEVLVPNSCRILGSKDYTIASIKNKLKNPKCAFLFFVSNYGLASKRNEAYNASVRLGKALSRTLDGDSFEDFLSSRDSEALWQSYVEVSAEEGKNSKGNVDRTLLIDAAELAFDIAEEHGHGNIVAWIRDEIAETRRCESAFTRLVEVRTFGPKAASAALRDVVFFYELEDEIEYSDRLYLQPINKVVRQIAKLILPEEGDLPDWILAGKVSKAVRLSQASGVRFSMGCNYLGYRLAPRSGGIEQAIRLLNIESTNQA
jgi:hypothetical protein